MNRLAAIACLLPAALCAVALAADQKADPKADMKARVARYYADGLEIPLLAMHTGTLVISECADRFAAECSERQKMAAAPDSESEILDLLTLFPLHVTSTPESRAKNYAEMRERLAWLSDQMLIHTASYDLLLFSRYGATLRACPQKDVAEWRESLQHMAAIEFKQFVGLEGQDLKDAVEKMVLEDIRLAGVIQRDWAPGECVAAQETGLTLLQFMYTKLEPWMPGGKHPEGSDVRRGAVAEFLYSAAIELESMVNPSVKEQIIALDKRRDKARGTKP
jgi:hypothetical protein